MQHHRKVARKRGHRAQGQQTGGALVVVEAVHRTLMGVYQGPASNIVGAMRAGDPIELHDVVELSHVEQPIRVQSAIAGADGQQQGQVTLQHMSRPHMLDHAPCPLPTVHTLVTGFYLVADLPGPAREMYEGQYLALLATGAKALDELRAAIERAKTMGEGKTGGEAGEVGETGQQAAAKLAPAVTLS